MDWIQIVVLALLQGLTEFLPISSSAHLILPAQLTDWPDQGLAFDVALHFGSLIAVLLYFRRDISGFVSSARRWIHGHGMDAQLRLLFKICLATTPIIIVGAVLGKWVELNLRSTLVIALATIGFGLLLWWADRRRGGTTTLTWQQALIIGAAQVLALIPGTSRSGITITAALALGLDRSTAARTSFLLSIPTITGAAVLKLPQALTAQTGVSPEALLAGALIAGVSAYSCIHIFVALVERTGMLPYVIYRLILGTVLLGLISTGLAN